MKEHSFDLSANSNEELVNLFNKEVDNSGWVSARPIFLQALRNELMVRGINISNVINETGGFNLSKKVELKENTLVTV